MDRHLFGTDGVRGLAGEYPLDTSGLNSIGMSVGQLFAGPGDKVVIGWDTRESSTELVKRLSIGLARQGVKVILAGVIPTPGLSYVTRLRHDFVAGVMVTASHNTYEYNGVKVFDNLGNKLSDEVEATLNKLIVSELTDRDDGGEAETDTTLIKEYEDFLLSTAPELRLDDLKVGIDCANGASSGLAERVFNRLGAHVSVMAAEPDGRNINEGCGATDTKALAEMVLRDKLDVGVAFDGDADRLIMVDSLGREVKGDYLLYLLAVVRKTDGVVATVMSNKGFENALNRHGIKLLRTDVGDRYVLEGLNRTGYKLGGEASGHIIFPLVLSTGDGLLAAVQTLRAIETSHKSLALWCDEVELLPQALVNLSLKDKALLNDLKVTEFIENAAASLNEGRLLIRPSGTEPVVRLMVEAPDADNVVKQLAEQLQAILNELESVHA